MGEQVITAGVGTGQPNVQADVACVQGLLNSHAGVTGLAALTVDGVCGPETVAAIVAYQSAGMGMAAPDGVVSPGGPTFTSLAGTAGTVAPAASVPALLQPQAMPPSVLGDADYQAAATTLGCEVAAIVAVSTVETGPQGPFEAQGRPTILFERHIFSGLTGGAYDASEPDISNPVPGGYGLYSAQYSRLARAAALNFDAALASASWGAFQIMGENFGEAGFGGVEAFVAAMRTGVSAHLQAFTRFVAADPVKLKAIQTKNWATFASRYNGPSYRQSGYDVKLANAYASNSQG